MITVRVYRVRLRHDGGTVAIDINAASPEAARDLVCSIECAPRSAVRSVKLLSEKVF